MLPRVQAFPLPPPLPRPPSSPLRFRPLAPLALRSCFARPSRSGTTRCAPRAFRAWARPTVCWSRPPPSPIKRPPWRGARHLRAPPPPSRHTLCSSSAARRRLRGKERRLRRSTHRPGCSTAHKLCPPCTGRVAVTFRFGRRSGSVGCTYVHRHRIDTDYCVL